MTQSSVILTLMLTHEIDLIWLEQKRQYFILLSVFIRSSTHLVDLAKIASFKLLQQEETFAVQDFRKLTNL